MKQKYLFYFIFLNIIAKVTIFSYFIIIFVFEGLFDNLYPCKKLIIKTYIT